MPITVKHGSENLAAFARLAALLGANQARVPQLPQIQNTNFGVGGGGGGGGGRGIRTSGLPFGSAASRRTPSSEELLRLQMQSQLQEERFGMPAQIERMQAEAKAKADQWEFEFSAKQRQEIARMNESRQAIINSDSFTPEEKQTAIRLIDLQQANIQPGMIPRDPSKPQYPEGKDVGQMWVDEGGTLIARKPDGSLQLIQRHDQGPESQAATLKAEQENKVAELQTKREEKLFDLRAELLREEVERPDEKGVPTKRRRTVAEVNEIMRDITGEVEAKPLWWENAAEQGLVVKEEDKDMPEGAGYSQAFLRTLAEKYDTFEEVPDEYKVLAREANKEIERYKASLAGRRR